MRRRIVPILIAPHECGLPRSSRMLTAAPPAHRPSGQAGSGVRWIVQAAPFQRSAMVAAWLLPTVTQAVADAHDTLAGRTTGSWPGGAGGTGRRRIVHRLPSQCSAMPEMPAL